MRSSKEPIKVLASHYNVSVATARKWNGRDDAQDRYHRPHTLATTLSAGQQLLIVQFTVDAFAEI